MAKKRPDKHSLDEDVVIDVEYEVINDEGGDRQQRRKVVDNVRRRAGEALGGTPSQELSEEEKEAIIGEVNSAFDVGSGLNQIDESNLTDEQLGKIDHYKSQIDFNNSMTITSYGVANQTLVKQAAEQLKRSAGSSELGEQIMNLDRQFTDYKRMLSVKNADNPVVRLFGKMWEKYMEWSDRRKTISDYITKFEEFAKSQGKTMDDDAKLVAKLWEENKERFEDLVLLRIALEEKMDEEEALIEQKESEREPGETGLMLDQDIDRHRRHLKLAKGRYDALYRSQLLAVYLARHYNILETGVALLKEDMYAVLNEQIPQWKIWFVIDGIIEDAKMTVALSQGVSETTNAMAVTTTENLMDAASNILENSGKPVYTTETFIQMGRSMEAAGVKWRAIEAAKEQAEEDGLQKIKGILNEMMSNDKKGSKKGK